MKLLFVGTNKGGGGTESHFVTLARAMESAGHEVAAIVYPGAPIYIGLSGSGVELHDGVFRNAFDPRGIRAVWKVCRHFRPDWIIGSFSKEYWPLAILARLLGVKLALFKHMDFAMRPSTNYAIPRLAKRFIVISDFMAKQFSARGVPSDLIRVLYNPLDIEYFKHDQILRQATRKSLGYTNDDIVLGYIGAMHPDKGIFILAEAVSQAMLQIPELKVLWLGEGPVAGELAGRLESSGFSSRHNIRQWSADVRPYYSVLDMLAIPSIKSETFGRVSIEAQASGVPVLCSNIGGIPETLSPEITGMLLPPGDIAAWRDAIIKMALNERMRKNMAERGRDWVEKQFGAKVIGQQFEEMLKDEC